MENLQLTTLVDNVPSLCLAEVDTVLTAAGSLESEAVGRGLLVTIDGANSAVSNTYDTIGDAILRCARKPT